MKIALLAASSILFLFSCSTLALAKAVFQEIAGLQIMIISAMLFCTACILDALKKD